MLKLATLLDNPGEPHPETRYRDPGHLKALGYNGLVLYETTGLSGVETAESVGTGEMCRWVQGQFEAIQETLQAAQRAGLAAYISYDALSLPLATVEKEPAHLVCKNRARVLCPASDAVLDRSLGALEGQLARWPGISGVVLRFGDSDAGRIPYLVGNDIYSPHCPRCSELGRADRIVRLLARFHALVVEKLGLRLIARAWNVRPDGLHDSRDLAQRVRDRLPGSPRDDRFILSFKFTQADFWRFQKWNPSSLVMGDRPIIYELQCQREFEGKGGLPNWQVPLWRDGSPESARDGEPAGLAQVADQVNLAGLWAWVRGGGWGGPFIRNEAWIDANVVAVPALADNPRIASADLAERWIRERLHLVAPDAVAAMRQALEHSPQVVLDGFYIGPYARARPGPWHPNGDWVQDDLIDVAAAWRMVQRLPESELDDIVREKERAVGRLAADRAAVQHSLNDRNRSTLEPLVNTMIWAESLFEALRDLLAGLVAYRRWQRSRGQAAAAQCRQRLLLAQSHWNHHTQRHGASPGAASSFRESQFWELTQRILGELG